MFRIVLQTIFSTANCAKEIAGSTRFFRFVDFAGMPPHISSKLAKAKVPGGARIRYVSMASFGEDYYYFLHDNGKVPIAS